MMQVMCSKGTDRVCDGSCDDPGCMAKHPPQVAINCGNCERLARENAEWRTFGMIEVATRNPNVASYVKEWEARAERAEAELAALRKRVSDAPVVTLGAIVRGDVVMSVMDDPGKRVHLVEESV